VGVLSCVSIFARGGAQAETAPAIKASAVPVAIAANTLLLEAEDGIDSTPSAPGAAGEATHAPEPAPVVLAKFHAKTCSAAAVRVPRGGVRVVTASHCAAEGLALFDGQRWVHPHAAVKAADGTDLAVLDFGKAHWAGLATRPAAGVSIGERLCAWRVSRGGDGVRRERICARLVDRKARDGAQYPWLVMSHPYPAGTSGSPLVDAEGRAVGIVVASDGLSGFAEPIEAVFAIGAARGVARR